ncbi:hypothetical protein [Derxia gummosa]|uniref:Nucleotidyltransferase family protein n=1 Tax=Derxia gummosa DSM 723 TaxID=1121388 RepID=A0A8B6X9Y3_9BURK|nr:hypothetical protein [Derxia gummosa]
MRSLKPERPVPAFIADIAAEVGEAAARLGLDCLIVGATARDLLLDHVHGLPAPRATRDIDMAFALAGWPDYERLRAALLACPGWHASAAQTQRLLRVHGGSPVPVDLIPFGAIESGDRTIAWPPGHDAATLARPDTRAAITALLDDASLCTKLALGLARALPDDDSDHASRLLAAFAAGFRHGPMTE